MKIFYLAFGQALPTYYQACFSILSLLKETAAAEIVVTTDRPHLFRYFEGRIQINPIDQQTLDMWKGSTGFFWRIKIKAIEDMVSRFPGEHILFLDADTFLENGIERIEAILDTGSSLMHEGEGLLCEIAGKTEKSMCKAYNGKSFQGITIRRDTTMWNSGVVGIPGDKALDAVRLTLALNDEMCVTKVRLGILEQFVFSLALSHTYGAISPANQWVGHYWGNKSQWNDVISTFFLRSLLEERTLEQDIAEMRSFDYSALPVRVKGQRKWLSRLRHTLDKRYPPEPHYYHPTSDFR